MTNSLRIKSSIALLDAVARVGRRYPAKPDLSQIEPFKPYLKDGQLELSKLDIRDGGVTRREAILRFLLLSAVIDQGPDIEGIREFARGVVNQLYSEEVRIFHRPLSFFERFNLTVKSIEDVHKIVKAARSAAWAEANNTRASKYNLYMENSRQTLGYAVYRWGAPIGLAHILVQDATERKQDATAVLQQYLRTWASAEEMSQQIKDHSRLGLGKAIGDKAGHLFAKWTIFSYPLLQDAGNTAWDQWSYELPFDSNAGRVMYRTGLILHWSTPEQLVAWEVIQKSAGKGGLDYMRVTNLRGKASTVAHSEPDLLAANHDLCVNHIRSHRRCPQKVEMQRIPSALSMHARSFVPGEIDDGLIKVGTTWCFNHANPNCRSCPLRKLCAGATSRPDLIANVRT